MIADGSGKDVARSSAAATVAGHGVVERGWSMWFHGAPRSKRPFGTAAANAVIAARSRASTGRSACQHSAQTPRTLADVGLGTAGVLSSTEPTSCLFAIHAEQTMQARTRVERPSSQWLVARRNSGSRNNRMGLLRRLRNGPRPGRKRRKELPPPWANSRLLGLGNLGLQARHVVT